MKKYLVLLGFLVVMTALLTACGAPAAPTAAPVPPTEAPTVVPPTEAPTAAPELSGDSLRGGKLYDIWFEELDVTPPSDVSKLWQANSKAGDTAPEDSYRCAVCHGFDYKGDLGFPGISADAGKDPNEILAVLKGSTDPNHDFSSYMDDQALADIALFVSKEQIDVTAITADGKPVNGNVDAGKKRFDSTCIDCHGPNAIAINFGNDAEPEYPATIATDGTVEFVTKLRFGQPGVPKMPSGIDNGWKNQDFADVIAYVQTLPQSSPVTEGGRIYDNWIAALGAAAPTSDMPLWKTQKNNTALTGGDTWLCSSCHGLDYKGVDGLNAAGTEGYTGFKGILQAQTMSEADLTGWLDGSKNKDHDFKSYFNADEMARVAAFIQKGMVDHTSFVGADGKSTGDPAHGKVLFTSVCKVCHGDDGKTRNFKADEGGTEYVGTVATNEPFGFLHVATVGVPGEHMPAGMNLNWSAKDIADVLAWAQTLPIK
ncbi:MAG: c-type cytochrome [Chloroflexota bacterium]